VIFCSFLFQFMAYIARHHLSLVLLYPEALHSNKKRASSSSPTMRSCAWFLCVALLLCGGAPSLVAAAPKKVAATSSNRYLYKASGTPFVREYVVGSKNATLDFRSSTAPRVVQFYSPDCVRVTLGRRVFCVGIALHSCLSLSHTRTYIAARSISLTLSFPCLQQHPCRISHSPTARRFGPSTRKSPKRYI
jgi:hypothetical protein